MHVFDRVGGRRLGAFVAAAAIAASTLITGFRPAQAAVVVQDTFQRANQSGWGTASNAMTWSASAGMTSGGTLSVSGNEGLINNSGQHSTFESLGSAVTADGNGLVRFALSDTTDAAGILLRQQSDGSAELAMVGGGDLTFLVRSAGSWTVISNTAFSPAANTFYWLRFELQGSNVFLKVWGATTTEPAAWTWSGSNSTITNSGQMGLYGYAQNGAPVEFDSFSVSTVSVVNGPTAALTVSPGTAAAGASVMANASGSTAGSSAISTYAFNFGDGTTVGPQAGSTATHAYSKGGVFTVTVTVTDSAGNSSQASAQETIGAPTASLKVTPPSGAPPLAVTADGSASTDTAGVSITQYTFNFGDGTTVGPQSGATATHTYAATGSYTVTLTVADSTSASSTATSTVVVSSPPVAALTVTPASGSTPLAVTADASASKAGTNAIASYAFNFGDGTTVGPQTGATTTHTYQTGGTFTVTVAVTDSAGASSTASQTVQATASYIVQDTFQRANQNGWGTASNGMTWAGSPGITSGGALSVSGNEGLINNSGQHSTFESLGNATTADGNGLVRFAFSNTADAAGILLRQQSDGSAELAMVGSGDLTFLVRSGGSWSVISNTAFSPAANTFYWLRFELQGSNVFLKVWAANTTEPTAWTWSGSNSTITNSGQMGLYGYAQNSAPVDFDSFSVRPLGPTASLSLSPSSTPAGTSVTANASASTPGVNPISSYTFNFGDGTSVGPQTAATASHVYGAGGSYVVTVTVTDSGGSSAQATAVETVGQPSAVLSLKPSSGSPPLAVTADGSASTDAGVVSITAYSFNFGDGTTAGPQTNPKATHTYTAVGSFSVTLTVTDSTGATATASGTVSVVNGPTAALTVSPGTAAAGVSVTANASGSTAGSSPISTYAFNFGDGTTAGPQAGSTATHAYSKGGVFTVTVTVTDTAGNSSQASAQETIGAPSAALKVTPSSGAPPLAVTADGSASTDTPGVSITQYTFNFGDGTTVGPQSGATATHTYAATGSYTVTLTVADSTGASSTATSTVVVSSPPVAALTVTPASGSTPLPVTADASASKAGTNAIASFAFNFGDGTTVGPQTGATAAHTYQAGGVFTVTVTVTDTAGTSSSASQSVQATASYIVQDTFQRANQNGWGTASNGMTWSASVGIASGGSLSVSGNEGLINNSGQHSTFESLGSAVTVDGNGLVRFAFSNTADAAGILLRQQSDGSAELAMVGSGDLTFLVRSGGSWSVISNTAFSPAANTFYWLRFELQGSNVFLKVWAASTTEPAAWTWSGSNSTITNSGQMGLYGYAQNSAPVDFDSFSVANVATQAPNSVIKGTLTDSLSGAGVSGVTVSTSPSTTTATTASNGTYSLPVPAGSYTVVFNASSVGYNNNDAAGVSAPTNGSATVNRSLVAIPSMVAMDNFTQPDQGGGWSPSTDGSVWTSDINSPPNNAPINGAGITSNQAWVDTSGSTFQDFDTWMGYQYANQDVTADIDVATVVNDSTYQHGARLMARVQGPLSNWNAVVMTIDPPNGSSPVPPGSSQPCTSGDISLWVTIPSSWTKLAMICQTVTVGTTYHAELEVIGTLVQGRVWTGSTTPAWQIVSAQSLLNGTGQAGTRTTGAYVNYANFKEVPVQQIAGQITAASTGAPIAGATVTLSNGLSTTTDSNGNYSFSGTSAAILGGTNYSVSASATGHTPNSAPASTGWGATTTVNVSLS